MSDDDSITTPRRCTKCGEEKPLTGEYFNRSTKAKDGFYSQCRECRKAYRESNRDRINEKKRADYYANHEKSLEQRRRTYQKYGEIYKARFRQKWAENNAEMNRRWSEYRAENRERIREYNREWRERNPERVSEHAHHTYVKHREKRLQQARLDRQQNPEKYRLKHRRYYLANRTLHLQKNRAYFARNPHLRRIHFENRKARLRNLPHSFTVADWQRALAYFNGCCATCGRQLKDLFATHTAAADHWIALTDPRPDNPGTVPWNIVPLCHGEGGCNNRKSSRQAWEFLETEFGKRKAKEVLERIEAYFKAIKPAE